MVLGKYDDAKQKFIEAIKAEQFAFIAHFYLGVLYKNQNNNREADIQFQSALDEICKQSSGEDLNIHLKAYMSLVLAFKGEKELANTLLEEIACVEDHDAEVHNCMARAYAALGEEEKALCCIRESMKHHDGPTEKEISLDPLLQSII
jgi:Tfp pilus assembly protein PilF